MNRLGLAVICCLTVSACGQPMYENSYARRPLADVLREPRQEKPEENRSFAYFHALGLEMDRGRIQPRFERARAHCLQDVSIQCKLDSAEMDSGDDYVNATLIVELPHEQIALFQKNLLSALPGEAADDVHVTSRSTQAQNVQQEKTDISHRLTQLTDYRDRLNALAKRANASVEDLIKIESELSNVEGQIEQLSAQGRDVSGRVAREQLSVLMTEHESLSDAFRPLGRVWRGSISLLARSAADALQFIIQIIPWLPIIALVIFLAPWLWKWARNSGRRA